MDLSDVKDLMLQMRLQGITSLAYEQGDTKIRLERPAAAAEAPDPCCVEVRHDKAEPAAYQPETDEDPCIEIHSPVVGVYFAAPSPDSAPFVRVGDAVDAGQTLCIVEAMKLMNEVTTPCAGILTGILQENGSNVEYGQLLFRIRPTDAG